MRDQVSVIKQCGCGDPCIGNLDSAAVRSGRDHYIGPPQNQAAGRWHGHKTLHEVVEPLDATRAPLGQYYPLLQFRFRHEGHQELPVPEQWQVKLRSTVILEKKRDYVRVNYSRRHAA